MIQATHQDKHLVINILVSAFDPVKKDNSINLIVGHGPDRVKRLHLLMSYLFDRAIRYGIIYLSDNKQACVLIKYSDKEKTNLLTIKSDINLVLKCIGVKNAWNIWKRQKFIKKAYPNEPHFQPMIAGVLCDTRGQGTAARLMFQMIHEHPLNHLPVIIDTVLEENVKLYQRLGFKIIHKNQSLGFTIYILRLN